MDYERTLPTKVFFEGPPVSGNTEHNETEAGVVLRSRAAGSQTIGKEKAGRNHVVASLSNSTH